MEPLNPRARHRAARGQGQGSAHAGADLRRLPRRPGGLLLRHAARGHLRLLLPHPRARPTGRFIQPPAKAEMMYDAAVVRGFGGARRGSTVARRSEPRHAAVRAAAKVPAPVGRVGPARRLLVPRVARAGDLARALVSPEPTLLLRDRHGRFLGEVGAQGADAEFGYWPVDAVPAAGGRGDARASRTGASAAHPGVDPLAAGPRPRSRTCASGGASPAPRRWPCRWRACSMPGARDLPAQGARGADRRLPDRAPRPRGGARATTCASCPTATASTASRYAARRYLDKPVEDLSLGRDRLPLPPSRRRPRA